MLFVRTVLLVLLLAAGVSFAMFALTGRSHHKARGLKILKWTLVGAFMFFAVLIWDKVA